jgi:hypothetical protein
MRLFKGCFWPKKGAILQKNRGPTEIILHFFSRFSGFLGFSPLQAVLFQGPAPVRPLQKKSCLKSYRRFFVRSAMCHNRRMNIQNSSMGNGPGEIRGTGTGPQTPARKTRNSHRRLLQFSPARKRLVQASTSQYK